MTPEQLRASILQYAIQGKLVEQRSEEGTAEELYKQIQEEKQKLIKEGKIKKGKSLAEITEDEIPFEIPEGWKWVRLAEVCKQISDGTHKTPNYVTEGVPFVSVKDISSGYMDFSNTKFITDEEHQVLCSRCKPEKGDVLICRIGTLGKALTIDVDREFSIFVSLGLIKPVLTEMADYIVLIINSGYGFTWIQNNKVGGGTHTFKINLDDLRQMIIPMPPVEEQQRIVNKVKEFIPYIERYGKCHKKLEQFNATFPEEMKKSILQYAIQGKLVEQKAEEGTAEDLYHLIQDERQKLIKEGKIKKEKPLADILEDEIPFDIPDSWKWVRVGNVIKEVIVPQRDKPHFSEKGIPWCRIEDRDGILLNGSKSNQLVSDETIEEMNLRVIPKGSVLSACTGGSIGTIVVNTVECCTNQTFNALVCSKGLFNWYLFWYLSTQFDALRRSGTGTTIAYISQDKSRNMLIPLPPLAEQHRIVEKIEKLLPYCDRLINQVD